MSHETEYDLPELDVEQPVDEDLDQEPELEVDQAGPPGEQEQPLAPPQFDYNDRLYAFGFSTSGKSEVLNLIFSGIACQRILIDTKPEFHIDDVPPAHHPGEIDWSAPIIHYQPLPGTECDQYEPIFQQALTLPGPRVVCVHEVQDLVDYKPQKAGRWLLGYAAKGARLGKGLLAGSQRPRLVPSSSITEARHIVVMVPQLARQDDNVTAAELISPVHSQVFRVDDLQRELALLEQQHGHYSFLWKDRKTGQLIAFPPIPQHLRDFSIVDRLDEAA